MNLIIKKVTLVAAPTPPVPPVPEYEGTLLTVSVPADDPTIAIREVLKAEGVSSFTVNWGDGSIETISLSSETLAHTYAASGTYHVILSDGLNSFAYIGPNYAEAERYRNRLVGLRSKATKLTTTLNDAFRDCAALRTLDLSSCSLQTLRARVFQGCASISGKIYLPCVATIVGGGTVMPFSGCTGGITEIHFAAANEESIKSGRAYAADSTLGTGTASCIFDL